MTLDPFPDDPYESLLGIPPAIRPPNHYDLIGAQMFEGDIKTLADTADAQIIRLRKIKADPEVQKQLLSELYIARGVLTNPGTKAGYDQQLRQDFEYPAELFAVPVHTNHTEDEPFVSLLSPRKRKQSSSMFAPVVVNLIIGACALAYFRPWEPRDEAPLPEKPKQQANPNVGFWPEKPKPRTRKLDIVPLDPPRADPAPVVRDGKPIKSPPQIVDLDPILGDQSPEIEPDEPAPKAAPDHLPVPSQEDQKKAVAAILDVYNKEFDAANKPKASPQLKIELAEEFAKRADEVKDAAQSFVLLGIASQLATAGARLDLAIDYAGRMADRFDADELVLRWEVISQYPKERSKEPEYRQIVRDFFREAQETEHLELALAAMERLQKFHPKSPLWKTIELSRTVLAIQTLRGNPDDSQSAQQVGEYLCFTLEHWQSGLPLLAKGNVQKIAELAAADIDNPADRASREAIADGWWNLGESLLKSSETEAAACHARAAFWYRTLLGNRGREER